MRVTQTTLPIYSVFYTRSKIDPKPQYQRGSVWTEVQRQLLIDSILRGYDIPKLYLRELANHSTYEFEVVDGQQRLRAIWDFMDNQYGLGEISNDLYDNENLVGRTFQSLNTTIQNKIEIQKLKDSINYDAILYFQRPNSTIGRDGKIATH